MIFFEGEYETISSPPRAGMGNWAASTGGTDSKTHRAITPTVHPKAQACAPRSAAVR